MFLNHLGSSLLVTLYLFEDHLDFTFNCKKCYHISKSSCKQQISCHIYIVKEKLFIFVLFIIVLLNKLSVLLISEISFHFFLIICKKSYKFNFVYIIHSHKNVVDNVILIHDILCKMVYLAKK